MRLGFSEFILLSAIFLLLFGPTVIPRVKRWLKRANTAQKQARKARAALDKQLAAERDYYLHRFQVAAGLLIGLVVFGYGGYLLLHPAQPAPTTYTPVTAAPLQLVTTGTDATVTLDISPYKNPVCVTAQDGWLYAAVDSAVIRIREDGTGLGKVCDSPGEVTDLAFGPDGILYLSVIGEAGTLKGRGAIFALNFDGLALGQRPIVNNINGEALQHPAALAIAADGKVYFTEYASANAYEAGGAAYAGYTELLAHTGTGAAYVYDPVEKAVAMVTAGLQGAGGIALSADGSTLYLSDTNNSRVWALPADTRGSDIAADGRLLVDGLPGYAAGLNLAPDGSLWGAVYGERIDWIDNAAGTPLVRKIAMNLPRLTQRWLLQPKDGQTGWAVALDADGNLTRACAVRLQSGGVLDVCETETAVWMVSGAGSTLYGAPKK